jgi:phosphopantothenoylcysteine decarboxylase/phosphopantothenate--cysteine ligase
MGVAESIVMSGQRILLIVGGGIAAYKACELVRTIRKEGGEVTCVLTESGAQFVTPMALAALSENPVYTTLWDLKNEAEMGHIQLSREADLIVVCPATANLLAKMASGIADDLATTLLLATNKPVMVIPAMNVRMWQHDATMRNIETLREAGVDVMPPDEGAMACGEFGPGRLPEPVMIWQRVAWALGMDPVEVAPLPVDGGYEPIPEDLSGLPLFGKHVLITAGPTWEPIDPVRYIANRSSGKQGFAIAAAAARAGARVTLVSGPVNLQTPPGVDRVDIESAVQMVEAVQGALPADIGVMVAAVADWRTLTVAKDKIKRRGSAPPAMFLTENPDILANLAGMPERPKLLIGFAAETEDVVKNAKDKRKRKGADWIIANDVSGDVMGGDANTVHIVTSKEVESLEEMPKDEVAKILVERFIDAFSKSVGK